MNNNYCYIIRNSSNLSRSGYTKWRSDESNWASINGEKYNNEYGKSLSDVREQFYPPRTRRFSFIDDYKNDVTESLEDTLRDETLSVNNDESIYHTPFLSANLEFLQNEKSPDYILLKPSDAETNERAFSRKYKHPAQKKPQRFEFSDADVKRTMIRHDEDFDYKNSEIDEENSAEIEKSNRDTSSKIRGMYTEGGIVQPKKHKITSDTSSKFIASS